MNESVKTVLKSGGVGVLPTDTLYGLVGQALSRRTVSRIYRLRKRNPKKPMIVLISSRADLKKLGVMVNGQMSKVFKKLWPGKVSIVLPCNTKRFSYLHRGRKTLAFRLPAERSLRKLLKLVGPLVAPSANVEGKPPARTISEAKKYFGDNVDFYVTAGRLASKPSTLVALTDKGLAVIRRGSTSIAPKRFRRP